MAGYNNVLLQIRRVPGVTTNDTLTVVLDGASQLEYRRGAELPPDQLAYLNKLDRDMDGGIQLGGRRIDNPNALRLCRHSQQVPPFRSGMATARSHGRGCRPSGELVSISCST